MRKREGVVKMLFGLVWMAGLGCITAILLWSGGSGYEHYLKLYGVGVL